MIASSLENNCDKGIHIQTSQALGFVYSFAELSMGDLDLGEYCYHTF